MGLRAACLALVMAAALPAHADDAAPKPWARNVSEESKAKAQALLEEGNALIVQNLYKEALGKYEAALTAWDHPAIRFNMVRALINLDRPLEAQDNLERALTYGADPLGAEVFAEASTYQRLLAQQIGRVTVSCDQAGVSVTVDGEPVGACPGEHALRLRVGAHTVGAEGAGRIAITRREAVGAGDNPPIAVRLVAIADATVTRTRWATWKPWAVTGAGVAVAGVGAALMLSARGLRSDYQDALTRECGELACSPDDLPVGTADLLDRAQFRDRLGVATVIGGGVAIAAGVTMVILNRPYAVLEHDAPTVAVTPTRGGAVVAVAGAL
jgi:tetratricopeptide (TPR) repeat protein